MRNQVFKKLFSVLLALIMVAGLLPASAMAGGWGAMDVDTTPELTETEQPAEPTPEQGEPVAEPTPEQGEPTAEPVPTQGEPTAEPTDEGIMPANVMPVQAETEINYVKKTKSVPLPDGTFYRIVHLDCGRKYFSEAQIKQIIDYAYNYGYTHVELAFGNDGLRFLLEDMSVTVGGTTYENDKVKAAIQQGNIAYSHAGELSEEEMGRIIAYAKGKGIGIIPMFDAPGHLQAVVKAMETMGVQVEYTTPTQSGGSLNYAVNTTNIVSVNFVQALMQKYITYFASKGCTMFNIAADECGFTKMSDDTYTAYAKLVNSMAAMVQNAGMTALAFNDGIYHKNLTTAVEFDTNIAICYWDASESTYASAAMLAGKGFKIINTHNKWYYVPGNADSDWFGYEWSKGYMNGEAKDCTKTDGGYSGNNVSGCMNAIWLDNPKESLTNEIWTKIENHIALLAQNNPTHFKAEEVKVPAVEITDENKNVKDVKKSEQGEGTYEVVLYKESSTLQTLKLTVANGAEGATYTWASNNEEVATVEYGLVTFNGAAGIVTITATPGAATRSIKETAAYSITLNVEVEGDVKLEEETITITVGQDATKKQDGKAEITSDYDATVVTISTEVKNVPGSTGKPTKVTTLVSGSKYIISDGNGHYLKRNGTSLINVSSPDQATEWTVTQDTQNTTVWHISDGIYYLSYYNTSWGLYVRTDASKYVSWAYDNNGFKYYDGNNYLKYRNNNWTVTSYSNGSYGAAYEKGEATPGGEQTTITFHGVKEGETTVVVGNVKYTIKVSPVELTGKYLPVQLWITNNTIEANGDNAANTGTSSGWGGDSSLGNANYVNIPAAVANSEQGVHMKDAFNAAGLIEPLKRYEWGGTRFINVKEGKPVMELVFWQGQVHTKANSNIQTVWGTDYSNSGTPFVYVRYWNDGSGYSWQVSADRQTWTTVTGEGSTGAYSGCTEQLAAYYMTRTEITDEITTDVADWGKPKPNGSTETEYDSQVSGDFVLLDFAVKYYDGTQKPLNFPVEGKTLAYHCASGDAAVGRNGSYTYRKLNNFRAVNSDNFEVYMVTVRMTSSEAGTTLSASEAKNGYTYDNNTEQIVWAIDENARLASGLDNYVSISGADSAYNGCKIGGDPYVRGVEVYNKHGALITYYVREKEVTDFLTVNYYVQGETTPFYTYTISVKQNTVFSQDFKWVSPTELTGNTVENVIGVTQTVQWDLKLMPQIGAQYRYTDYKFVDANREGDGKTVNLYYTFNATKTFVVDFGLPLTIRPRDLNENLANNGVSITETKLTGVSNFAYVSADTDGVITYKLKEMISQSDTFGVQYTGTLVVEGNDKPQEGTTAKYTVTIIPATNVYYEDSFAKFIDGAGAAASAQWEKVYDPGTDETTNANATQALEALGQAGHNPYGYDPKYNNCTMFSMGSARKVTVTNDMATTGVVWPTAQFTFKGTGFDIISLTDNTSGAIFVFVYKGTDTSTTGNRVRSHIVDNYYGYKQDENGNWVVDKENNNALYQIPVMRIRDLEYGEYTAVVKVFYDNAFDHTATGNSYSFWLDAVRVYDPMGKSENTGETYKPDGEGYPQYIKLRDAVANADASLAGSKALFIDGKENASISEYANYGPNNEVYLAQGQAIMFKLTSNLDKIATVQIGAKSPDSNDAKNANMVIRSATTGTEIKTATEMYYDISAAKDGNIVTITNTGEAILSLTNLKITYTESGKTVSLDEVSAEQQEKAVATVRALFAPAPIEPEPEPEPEKTFEPERFEASWSRNVMQGRKATLTVKTSEDVEAITVDGQTIRSYRTRTERVGFGRRAKRITYREFTYSMVAQESADFSVTAINAEGTESEAITARLTVKTRPNSMRDMWDWFKGWF